MFTPSDFYEFYQPSTCRKRVWLRARRPDLARDDNEFLELLKRRGRQVEERHLKTLGPYMQPEYPKRDLDKGAKATEALIKARTPVIYQGVLKSADGKFVAIPDFLIFDQEARQYRIRDAKLATNLEDHPEIGYQLGFDRLIAEQSWGYSPVLEVVKGDGNLESPFKAPDSSSVAAHTSEVLSLMEPDDEPEDPVGWSKCNECSFKSHCWDRAVEEKDIAVSPHVEQGMWRPIREIGARTYEELSSLQQSELSKVKFMRGGRVQSIGDSRAEKISRQTSSLSSGRILRMGSVSLAGGYGRGQRPIVMFDIENDIYDSELGVKVYLWGLLVVTKEGAGEPILIVAEQWKAGDEKGWRTFLKVAKGVFEHYGDIPFIHYGVHEKTWVGKYIERYGDLEGIASRVMTNLWDMQKEAVTKSLVLPLYSYSLKHVEALTGFKRSQKEYGGLWSLVTYDKYLNATSPEEAERILGSILTYNREDLLASLASYQWLEGMS